MEKRVKKRKAPSAAAVSRFLGEKFTRAERTNKGPTGIAAGFSVREGLGHLFRGVDWVVAEFEPGYYLRDRYFDNPEALLKAEQGMLRNYQEYLESRYDVSRNDEDGADDWNCLLVRAKKEE